jgi:hypothetical protein
MNLRTRRGAALDCGLRHPGLAATLAAPIVLHSWGSGEKGCLRMVVYRGRRYVARPVPPTQVVQAIAIGVGLARGCDAPPSNVDLRSLTGIKPTAAVGLAGDQVVGLRSSWAVLDLLLAQAHAMSSSERFLALDGPWPRRRAEPSSD